MTEHLLAGAATTDITPRGELPNYAGGRCRRDDSRPPLLAQAVVIGHPGREVALVVCDLLTVDRPLTLRLRDTCSRRTGISGDRIMVAATHTAAAPVTAPVLVTGPLPDPLYLDFLDEQVADAVDRAHRSRRPVVVVSGTCPAPGFELNRRSVRPDGSIAFTQWDPEWTIEGPTDPQLSYLGFDSPDGDPLALVVSYACHNISQSPFETGVFDPDLFGRLSARLRAEFPSLLAAPVLAGAQGNIVFGDPRRLLQLYGQDFADSGAGQCAELIIAAYRTAPRVAGGDLAFASQVLELPDRSLLDSTFCTDGCRGTTPADVAFARERYEPERLAIQRRGPSSCPVELSAVAVGGAALVTNAGKLFVEHGLRLRAESPFPTTMVANLVNGACGYIPTAQAFRNGGYETHRTVYTSRLVEHAGDTIVRASVDLLSGLIR